MNWKPHLPEIFLGISLGMIAIEAALSGAIIREVRASHSVREAVGVVFGPPGWRAEGQGLTSKNIRAGWEARYGG